MRVNVSSPVQLVSVLFSEPKIPQLSSETGSPSPGAVSVLFSEPKIPQSSTGVFLCYTHHVSVLFSEPKIPQFQSGVLNDLLPTRFSALQRAENSSITTLSIVTELECKFQCSSASRKFLNCIENARSSSSIFRFSALQRAENSSISDP